VSRRECSYPPDRVVPLRSNPQHLQRVVVENSRTNVATGGNDFSSTTGTEIDRRQIVSHRLGLTPQRWNCHQVQTRPKRLFSPAFHALHRRAEHRRRPSPPAISRIMYFLRNGAKVRRRENEDWQPTELRTAAVPIAGHRCQRRPDPNHVETPGSGPATVPAQIDGKWHLRKRRVGRFEREASPSFVSHEIAVRSHSSTREGDITV